MLSRCVHRVHEGQLWINAHQLEYLLETLEATPSTRLVNARGTVLLSKREEDVIDVWPRAWPIVKLPKS